LLASLSLSLSLSLCPGPHARLSAPAARLSIRILSATRGTHPSSCVDRASIRAPRFQGFFGGILQLSNDLDVRVVDAQFDPSMAPPHPYDDDDRPIPLTLTAVLLSLVDEDGQSVGRPSWSPILDVLELLGKDMVHTPEFASESDLRRRKRLQLHKVEQRRLALHHLKLQGNRKRLPTAWGETAGGSPPTQRAGATDDVEPVPPGSPRGSMMEGVQGLILQLQEAAPSKL